MSLDDSVMYLKGVGPKRAELLKKLGIETVRQLIYSKELYRLHLARADSRSPA